MTKWWISSALLCSCSVYAQTLEITARIYNQAHVSENTIITAKKEAAFALATAGVQVHWVNCDEPGRCDDAVGPNEFQILIRQAAPSAALGLKGVDAMGYALLPKDEQGSYALVYYGEICRFAERSPAVSSAEILGYVIAHEIGHLLLGPNHQDGTVMKGQWKKGEIEMIRKRELRFNHSQMTAGVRRRLVEERPVMLSAR